MISHNLYSINHYTVINDFNLKSNTIKQRLSVITENLVKNRPIRQTLYTVYIYLCVDIT